MKNRDFFIITAAYLLLFLGFLIKLQAVQLQNQNEHEIIEKKQQIAIDSFRMYYDEKYKANFNSKNGVYGLAFGEYIAVWTKNRNITAVLDTCTHEYAHNNLGLEDPTK